MLGDGQLDRQQRDRDGHHGVGEEHQPLGRAPVDVARSPAAPSTAPGRAPVVGPRFDPPRREGRGRRRSVTTLNPVARVADTRVTRVGRPGRCPIFMSESTDVASMSRAPTSTDAVSTDAGALLEPEALDDAARRGPQGVRRRDRPRRARRRQARASRRSRPGAAGPARAGVVARPAARGRREAGERGAHPGAGGVRRPSRAAGGRTRRAGARRGGRRRHPPLRPHARGAGTRSRRSASASPTCSSRWATRSPRARGRVVVAELRRAELQEGPPGAHHAGHLLPRRG